MTNNSSLQIDYFFDPFCGWCYASAPALEAFANTFPDSLRMMPSGLFADGNARSAASMADHAWRNDTRISELTGQRFTEAYRDDVLRKQDGIFDSGAATRALVALGDLSVALEPKFMHAVQIARYIDARDTTEAAEVAAVAVTVAAEAGFTIDAADFGKRLVGDDDLAQRASLRIARAQTAMRRLSVGGVPLVVVTANGRSEILQGAPLYLGADKALQAISQIEARLAAAT